MEIMAAISSFLLHVKVEKGLSPNTVSAYKRDLMKFNEFSKKRVKSIQAVTADDLVDFLAGLYRQNLESKTVARHLVTLRNFFRFSQIQEFIPADPSITLESPKIRRALPGYLRLEEVERLLSQADVNTPFGLRDRAMLEVLYSTGLRVSELVSLRVGDLDSKVGCVRCIGKGDKERIVPVGKKALAIVERYIRESRPVLLGETTGSYALFVNRSGRQLSRVENPLFLWSSRRPPRPSYAAHAAAQFCHSPAGTRRGSSFRADDAGTFRYFHHANLYARSGRAVEADLQSASSACITRRFE
jgi:integrase/recombinase XerD